MEIIFNIVLGIIILVYLILSLQLDKGSVTGDIFGAGGFPIVIAVIGLIILALITVQVLKNKTKVHIPMFDLKSQAGKAVVLNVVILSVYIIFMNIVGFVLSTALFLFSSARGMGYKKMNALLAYTLILTAVLVVAFGKLFFIPLPRGIGVFRELSYLIY